MLEPQPVSSLSSRPSSARPLPATTQAFFQPLSARFLFFSILTTKFYNHFAQPDVTKIAQDLEFFTAVRDCYSSLRGHWLKRTLKTPRSIFYVKVGADAASLSLILFSLHGWCWHLSSLSSFAIAVAMTLVFLKMKSLRKLRSERNDITTTLPLADSNAVEHVSPRNALSGVLWGLHTLKPRPKEAHNGNIRRPWARR